MKTSVIALMLICTFFLTLYGKTVVLGNNSPNEQVIYPGKILEGPDSNIYIYDNADAFIKVFSPEGKFIRKLGGKGEGPGQFKRADGLDFGFTPDGTKLHFTEYFMGHRWITFTDLNGVLKDTLEYKLRGFYGIAEAFIQDNETIFLRIDRSGKTERRSDVYYMSFESEIVVMNKKGIITSSVLKREYPERISFIKDGGDMGIPFTPEFLWLITRKGEVIFTDGTGNELHVYTKKGKLKQKIVVPVPGQEPVTKNDLYSWRKKRKGLFVGNKKSWYKRFGSVIEKYTKSIFKFKPVILGMTLTPAGNIFLKCRKKEKDQFKYVLTNINGELITESVSKFHRIQISKNYIFFMRVSEEEEQEISFLKRSGGETSDLREVFDLSH